MALTDDEAKDMLQALTAHYQQPVLPLSHFCTAIKTWFEAIKRNNTDPALKREGSGTVQGERYHEVLHLIERDIRKSNLLARLIYGGEKFRTVMCPTHKGHSGGECKDGCEGTGWLPEPDLVEVKATGGPTIGAWTAGDQASNGNWWKWTRSDGAVVQCHTNGLQLKGWIANGPGDGSQALRKTPGGPMVMFTTPYEARREVDKAYPLNEAKP